MVEVKISLQILYIGKEVTSFSEHIISILALPSQPFVSVTVTE